MDHYFILPVIFKNEEIAMNARLVALGYSYKFYVMVNGHEIIFEKDDEGEYRAVSDSTGVNVEKELLQAIVTALESI